MRVQMLIDLNFKQTRTPTSLTKNAVLLVGSTGTAKTSAVLMYGEYLDKAKMVFKRTNFSSATKPEGFQQTVETECDCKVGKDFAPPGNK